jgi:hypothetical protein
MWMALLLIAAAGAVDRIWILRHCDKPRDGPCCSALGYERAYAWGAYLSHRVPAAASVLYLEAGASSPRRCGVPANHSRAPVDAQCQRSERLRITSRILQDVLARPFVVHGGYCTGDARGILRRLARETAATDAVIVWEHTEIASLLAGLGHAGAEWPDPHRYDFAFLVSGGALYWDCAPLPNEVERTAIALPYSRIDASAEVPGPIKRRLADIQATVTSVYASLTAAAASVCAVVAIVIRTIGCATRARDELEALPLLRGEKDGL